MDENTVGNPLLTWEDVTPFPGIDTVGLTGFGSAVFYRFGCSLGLALPDGACITDADCGSLANTECKPRNIEHSSVTLQSCQCLTGFQPIPGTETVKEDGVSMCA